VTFGVGLGASLNRVYADLSHSSSEPVQVSIPGAPGQNGSVVKTGPGRGPALPSLAAQERAVTAALRAQPGTLDYVAESDDDVAVLGLPDRVSLIGFGGDASWTGYALISGHWYSGAGSGAQADVNTAFLTDTGAKVGDSYTLTSGRSHVTIQIAGEIFDPGGGRPEIIASQSTLAALAPGLAPDQYDVALTPGTGAQAYADALGAKLGQFYQVSPNSSSSSQFFVIIGLVATLTLLLTAVAGLGVLNTVVLQTRERVHDLGVFKAIGMTPRQTVTLVVCSVAGVGLVAGLIAIPAGIALHHLVLPAMAHAAQTDVPPSVLNVFQPWELVLLALSGLVIAVAGALGPAGWAAKTRTAFALRAE
jgi:putative ABC transport system permease protein